MELIYLHLIKNLITLIIHIHKYFKIVGSAHNLKEIKIKELQKLKKFLYPHCLKKIKIIWESINLKILS